MLVTNFYKIVFVFFLSFSIFLNKLVWHPSGFRQKDEGSCILGNRIEEERECNSISVIFLKFQRFRLEYDDNYHNLLPHTSLCR